MRAADDSRAVGTDLPPGAARDAPEKGAVSLTLGALQWGLRGAPAWVRVAARWWGDLTVDDDINCTKATKKKSKTPLKTPWVRLDERTGAEIIFPVKCKPSGFSRYCRDARVVVLEAGQRGPPSPPLPRGARYS